MSTIKIITGLINALIHLLKDTIAKSDHNILIPQNRKNKRNHLLLCNIFDQFIFLLHSMNNPVINNTTLETLSIALPSMYCSECVVKYCPPSQKETGLDALIIIQINGIQSTRETLGLVLKSIIKRNKTKKEHSISANCGGISSYQGITNKICSYFRSVRVLVYWKIKVS